MNKVFESINSIISKIDEVIDEYGDSPLEGSQFERECSNYPDRKLIINPFTFGRMNLMAGREHLVVLPSLFRHNNIFAGSVVARAVLEASSLAAWFLDPSIDGQERVRRGLVQLCAGKNEDNKSPGDKTGNENFFDNYLPEVCARLGIEFRNEGKIIEPRKLKVQISKIIKTQLGGKKRDAYSLLSGVVHGQNSVLMYFGYDLKNPIAKNGSHRFKSKPNQSIAPFALKTAVESYSKGIEYYFNISGWEFSKIQPALDVFHTLLSEHISSLV